MDLPLVIGIAIGALLLGGLVTWLIITKALKTRSERVVKEAEAEAEVIKKDKILQAKEKFLQLRTEHEKEINSRNSKMVNAENKLKQKEASISQRIFGLLHNSLTSCF